MPVIINDFEIIDEPPGDNRNANAEAQRAQPVQPPLRPEDIERIVQHFVERRQRLMAD